MRLYINLSILLFASAVVYAWDGIEDFDFKISEVHRLLKNKQMNCLDFVNYFLERSIRYNSLMNAIISYYPKLFEEASYLDNYYKKNNRFVGSLHCVPFIVKDNIDVKGIATTGGINALRYSVPYADADIVKKLRAEGAIIISKTNLAELAAGSYGSETGGICKNPWDFSRTCGPSSTGSGAGIAASFGLVGLGTDTEGSIMMPASANGLFGLRPPVDELSLTGIFPSFMKQDVPGPLAKYLDDVVLSYFIMAGKSNLFQDYLAASTKKIKVAYLDTFFKDFLVENAFGSFSYKIDTEVKTLLTKLVDDLKKVNVEVVEVKVSEAEFAQLLQSTLQMILTAESTSNACRKPSIEKYFNDENRFQSDSPFKTFDDFMKSPALSTYWSELFKNASGSSEAKCKTSENVYDQARIQYIQLFDVWYKRADVDILIFPTFPGLPAKLGSGDGGLNPVFIAPFLGYPTLNVPIGFSKATQEAPEGLPVGLLMLTKPQALMDTFKVAKIYENSFMKSRKLPRSTPLITNTRNKATTFSNLTFTYFLGFLLLICMKKIF